jgi:hypothetical protein
LPREGDEDPSLVIISGEEEAVLDCIDHLKVKTFYFIPLIILFYGLVPSVPDP